MPTTSNVTVPKNFAARLAVTLWASLAQLLRSPSHSRRAEARRRSARHVLWLSAGIGVLIIALMYWLDAVEIRLMPPRGTASLWPFKILTDFGKSAYVLWTLFGLLVAVLIVSAAFRGTARSLLLGFGTRVQFLFLSVLVPVLAGEVLKVAIGRGRPFVGGEANAFHFSHFHGSEAYQSLPSGHAITAFALAFAVSALWPQLRIVMFVYAVIIAMTRLVLLAHHPSDVVAGALVGIMGAMFVRYWFAARRLAFAIGPDGTVSPLPGPSFERFKRVARNPFGP